MKTTLYDRDIEDILVGEKGKIHIVYYVPVEEAIFTKEDLKYLLWLLDEDGEV